MSEFRCKFCGELIEKFSLGGWRECHGSEACKTYAVCYFFDGKLNRASFTIGYNDKLYEVVFNYDKQLTFIWCIGDDNWNSGIAVSFPFVSDNLTPSNIKDKLPLLLTFS